MDIIGFEKQKKHFKTLSDEGRLSHAYVFSGPEMIGKRRFALELFRIINGRSGLEVRNDPDLKYVAPSARDSEPATFVNYQPPKHERSGREIYVEDIHQARSFLATTPMYGPRKVLLINDAEAMGAESSNSLLKILEEPPSASLFILITAHPRLLLPTIASRCAQVRFGLLGTEAMDAYLKTRRLGADDASLVSLLADGRIGWAARLLDSGRLHDARRWVDEFQTVLKKGTYERMQYVKKIYEDETYPELVDVWLRWIRAHGKNPQKTAAVLRELIHLSHLITQPEMNHRLALENFLIGV